MKNPDMYTIETLIAELEDSMRDRRRDQLTSILNYASDYSLETAVHELRRLKETYKASIIHDKD